MLIIQISISRPTSFIVILTMFASNYINKIAYWHIGW